MEILSSRGALNKRVKNAKTISIVGYRKQLAKTSERCKELNRKLLSFFSELFKCKRVANLLKKDTIKQEITVALVCIFTRISVSYPVSVDEISSGTTFIP